MQQILEYSFARVLVRLTGVILFLYGLTHLITLINWTVYYLTDYPIGLSAGNVFREILPMVLRVLIGVGFGAYLARDGHILARILIAGMHGRCRRCGYDVRAVTGPTCPECGTPLPGEPPPAPTQSEGPGGHAPAHPHSTDPRR